jgi:hypothetical protein
MKSPPKNIKIAYSELAKQLKNNKSALSGTNSKINSVNYSVNRNNFTTNEKVDKIIYDMLQSSNLNQTVDQVVQSNFKISSRSANSNFNPQGIATKDTFSSSKIFSTNTVTKTSKHIFYIENPEELHFYNVNLIQQSKSLAYKFENLQKVESENILSNEDDISEN